jgi:hypothetical protein
LIVPPAGFEVQDAARVADREGADLVLDGYLKSQPACL